MKRGDTYTVECGYEGFHEIGDPTVTARQYTIPSAGECFEPFSCQAGECTTCPEKQNGYCYAVDGDYSAFATNDQLVCRCNEGFVNTYAPGNLPFDLLTCTNGIFDTSYMGICHPVQCANPADLLDEDGSVIGKPVRNSNGYKNYIGGAIEYKCRDGYVNSADHNPYAVCGDVHPDSDQYPKSGQFGYYGPIIGGCKRNSKYTSICRHFFICSAI